MKKDIYRGGMAMNIKHPRLQRNERGEIECFTPSQNKSRNTEALYNIDTDELFMAGVKIARHPKFTDIVAFENWCNRYWVEIYDREHETKK